MPINPIPGPMISPIQSAVQPSSVPPLPIESVTPLQKVQELPNESQKPQLAPTSVLPSVDPAPLIGNKPKIKTDKLPHKKENGIYKCNKCERTYLSYPALYTHNKLKHQPNQTSVNKPTNRGRPKKNVILTV